MEHDMFSERKRAEQDPDPYQYDEIPKELRNQILYVLRDAVSTFIPYRWDELWRKVWGVYCREKGLPLEMNNPSQAESYCYEIVTENIMEAAFDIIELTFRSMELYGVRKNRLEMATNELNRFFRKASVGYQLKGIQMVRIDSEYLHREVVVPALDFLRGDGFESANKEILSAHEHYRNGEYQDCITKANSAFESTMKVICDHRKWKYGKGTADDLVKVLQDKDLIPKYLQTHFQQLLSTLKSGLPPLRHNQGSAHGQGEKTTKVPAHLAGYALHLAATNILFLVQTSKPEN